MPKLGSSCLSMSIDSILPVDCVSQKFFRKLMSLSQPLAKMMASSFGYKKLLELAEELPLANLVIMSSTSLTVFPMKFKLLIGKRLVITLPFS